VLHYKYINTLFFFFLRSELVRGRHAGVGGSGGVAAHVLQQVTKWRESIALLPGRFTL